MVEYLRAKINDPKVRMLLEAGANINIKNDDQKTAFNLSTKYNYEESNVAILLLKHGADPKEYLRKNELAAYILNMLLNEQRQEFEQKLKEEKMKIYEEIYTPGGVGAQECIKRLNSYK